MRPVRYIIIRDKKAGNWGGTGYWVSVHRKWLGPGRIYNCRSKEEVKEVIEKAFPDDSDFGFDEQDYSADRFGFV